MVGMLGGEYVIIESSLVKVGISGLGAHAEESLGEFEHIVGVARLGTFAVIHITLGIGGRREMLATAVAAYRERAVVYDSLPEKCGCLAIVGVARELGHTLIAHDFGHLGVGMPVVEIVHSVAHAVKELVVGEASGRVEIFHFACHGIGIGIYLVHAAKLIIEHRLHLSVIKTSDDTKTPVTHAEKQIATHLRTGIEPAVTKSGIHLVYIIPRHPPVPYLTGIAFAQLTPQFVAVGYAPHISVTAGCRTHGKLAQHIIHTLFERAIAGSGIVDGKCRQIMTAHVAVKTVPIGKTLSFGLEACRFHIWSEQTVGVIAQQHVNVKVAGMAKRPVEQFDILQGKLIVIKSGLRVRQRRHTQHSHR